MYELEIKLREIGVWEQFVENCSFYSSVKREININTAFIWDVTPERDIFWRNISNKGGRELRALHMPKAYILEIKRGTPPRYVRELL